MGLTDDVCGVVPHEGSKFHEVATVDDPTGLRGLVEFFLDLRAEFLCGAGSPVWPPVEGIQADMRYIQQLRESSAQRGLASRSGKLG